MDKLPRYEALLNQSVILHLHLSLKSLDLLGNSIAAAHVDAAIQSLKDISMVDINTSELDAFLGRFGAKADVLNARYNLTTRSSREEDADADSLEIGTMI